MTKEERERIEQQMREYKAQGHTNVEVAKLFGCSKSHAQRICRGICDLSHDHNQYTDGRFDRVANAIRYINERTPEFEYAGNYTGIDGTVDLRCKTCGTIVTKSFITVRHGKAKCEECKRRNKEQRIAEQITIREEAIRRKTEERKDEMFAKMTGEQIGFAECLCCGGMFVRVGKRKKYCSSKCMNRAMNAASKDRRVRKLKEHSIDKGITLERLYEKNNGVCALCGCLCDWNDHHYKDGAFIAGEKYPSIDHIIPLSKGGTHSWDNVQLAHRKCNSRKGANIPL